MRRARAAVLTAAVGLAMAPGLRAEAQSFGEQSGPISIVADRSELQSGRSTIVWSGDVRVRQGEARLRADQVAVSFTSVEPDADRRIERIRAEGHVVYDTPAETAQADEAVYAAADDTVTLTGRVRLVRGDEVVCAHEIVLQPGARQFHARAGGGGEDSACPGRVRAVLDARRRGPGGAAPAPGG